MVSLWGWTISCGKGGLGEAFVREGPLMFGWESPTAEERREKNDSFGLDDCVYGDWRWRKG